MVQAVSSYRADQACGVRILPRTLGCGKYFFNAHGRDAQTDVVAVDAISIANKIARRIPIGEGLDDLLRRPGGGRNAALGDDHVPAR